MQPARRLALAGRLPQTPTMPHAKSLFSVAPASSAAGRGGGTCGAEPAPSERPHRPLRRARTRRRKRCDLAWRATSSDWCADYIGVRLHRCADYDKWCAIPPRPPHTAQRTTGARLSPCRTKNSQHNTQQVLVFSPLIQRTGNKKKKSRAGRCILTSIVSRLFVLRA